MPAWQARRYASAGWLFWVEAARRGERLIAYYIVSTNDFTKGVDGRKRMFVIRGIFSGLRHAFPN
eukprot:7672628-Lingulodinium_polyedra.AAC.1